MIRIVTSFQRIYDMLMLMITSDPYARTLGGGGTDGALNVLDESFESSGTQRASDPYDWLVIGNEWLNPGKTPSEMMIFLFGNDLTVDGLRGGARHLGVDAVRGDAGWLGADLQRNQGMDHRRHVADYSSSRIKAFDGMLATAFYGTAVLAYAPGFNSTTDPPGDVYGYFAHNKPMGKTYDWSVFADISSEYADVFTAYYTSKIMSGFSGVTDDDSWDAAMQMAPDHCGVAAGGINWEEIGYDSVDSFSDDYSSYYPSQGTFNNSMGLGDATRINRYVSATYVLEAIAFDYFDSNSVVTGDVDANEFLHSNQIYKNLNNSIQFELGASSTHDGVYITYFVSPTGDHYDAGGGTYNHLGVMFDSDVLKRMLQLKYSARFSGVSLGYRTIPTGAGFMSEDMQAGSQGIGNSMDYYDYPLDGFRSSTTPSSRAKIEAWQSRYGTHAWEVGAQERSVIAACAAIKEGYSVISIPKKLVSKVIKRQKIPNELVSAFGYIAPDSSEYGTSMASTGATAMNFEYQGVTSFEEAVDTNLAPGSDAYLAAYGQVASGAWDGMSWDGVDLSIPDEDPAKIICTQLFKAGLLSDSIFEADQAFGARLRVEDPEVMIGYTLWATPVVSLMQKSKMFTRVVYVIAKPWAEQMAYEMGARTRENLIGKMIMTIGKTFCRLVSRASAWELNHG